MTTDDHNIEHRSDNMMTQDNDSDPVETVNKVDFSSIELEIKKLATGSLDKDDPCKDFSTKHLPKILREYVDSLCDRTNAHPIMLTSSAFVNSSAFIKKKIYIPRGEYFQKLYCNLWELNITKSGQFKSTSLDLGNETSKEESAKITNIIKGVQKKIRLAKGAPEKATLQEELLEASLNDVLLPTKITSEALLQHLSEGHAGAILTSEFGAWLQNLEKNHNSDLKAIFTDLYDVPASYRYKTKESGDFILNEPFFSICGVSTLQWVKKNLKDDDIQSGFFARFLIYAPPHNDEIPSALPGQINPKNHRTEEKYKGVLMNMEDNYEYMLSPSARTYFEQAHNSLYKMVKSYSDKCQEFLDPFLKRWSPYILKKAMIIRLFEDPFSKEISDTSIHAAMSLILPAIKSTASLFEGELGESDHQKKCRIIFEYIVKKTNEKKAPVTWKEIVESKKLGGGSLEYEYVCKTLIESGKIIHYQKETKKDGLYLPNNQ